MKKIDLSNYGFRKGFNFENRFHLRTEVKYKDESYTVSTVDLGFNHSYIREIEIYYETMIYKNAESAGERWGYSNPFRYFQERYSTEKEARKRHKEIVKLFKNGKVDELL